MKKQFKTRLVLNSQTIRRLRNDGLPAVQGGRPVDDSVDVCITALCTAGCRGCG